MTKKILPMLFCSIWLAFGCSEEPEPRSVRDYLENPQFLEAAVVRCARNRSQTRYEVECVNARQAVSVIEAREERSKREKLEAQSERKRDALRRTQVAASEARRRAAEIVRLQEEAEYRAQFGAMPSRESVAGGSSLGITVPGEAITTVDDGFSSDTPPVIFDEPVQRDEQVGHIDESMPASDGGNAPGMTTESESSD